MNDTTMINESHDNDLSVDDDANNNNNNVVSLQDRLLAVKKAVRKATAEALQQSHSDQIVAKPQFEDNALPENMDPNASFLLGMELFGQEPSVLERKIQEKLQQLQDELNQIVVVSVGEQQPQPSNTNAAEMEASTTTTNSMTSPHTLQKEASRLTHKIQFLQACSKARALLDESMTLSSSALTSEPDWVLAAQRLAEAQQAAKQAEAIVVQEQQQQPPNTNMTGNNQGQGDAEQQQQQQPSEAILAAYRIVDSILHPIRRKRVELIARATSLLESSITITSSSLTIKGGHDPNASHHDVNSSRSGVDVDDNDNHPSNTSHTTHIPPIQGISAAFQVLAAFDEQGSSALQEAIRKLTKQLHEQVLVPVLDEYRKNTYLTSTSTGATCPWTFEETTGRSNAGLKARLNVTTGTSSASGLTHHLEWHRSNKPTATSTSSSSKAATVDKNMDATTAMKTAVAAWKETFVFLQRILAFVEEHILLHHTNLVQLVGKRLFGKPDALPTSLSLEALGIQSNLLAEDHGMLTAPILELMNETCIPDYLTVEQVQALPAIADELKSVVGPFEAFLVDKSLLPPANNESGDNSLSRLGAFAQNLEQHYIDKRRGTLLNEARDLLLNKDYHNTVEVGVEVKPNKGTDLEILDDDGMSVFQLHKSCISQTSSQLMELCRQTMEEAVEQSSAVATDDKHESLALLSPNLYRTARDILELFRAIIPSALSQEIAHVPRTAALLHNDCVFFSHHCLTLGLEYKDRFPAPEATQGSNLLRQTCLFVDMVPPFRELANRSMGDMLDLQKRELVEIVGDRITYLGETLQSNDSVAEWSEAETALTAGIYHIRHLSQAWRPILSQQVFSRSMGHLADAIFALYLEQVLKVSDISQSGCHFVSALFEKATRSITALLNDDTTGSRLWDRFTAVGSFMDMSLADIEAALAQGVFRNVTGPELSSLITATFADSEKRRNLLQLLVVD